MSGTGVSFNGSQNITISGTTIGSGVIDNDNISSSAAIADTKLDTISTAGKVNNSATSAVSTNTASAIVLRDASGNFSAGTITANLTGNVTGTVSSLSNHTATIRGVMVAGSGINYDSASGVISTVVAGVDSSATLSLFSVDSSANTGDGSLTYNDAGVFTYKGPTASETRAHFSQGTGITITNGQIATTITQYTDADAQGAISHTNTGTGFGSIGYNSGTGVINFNKVTNANIRSVLNAGGDLSYDSSTGTMSFDETYSTANELLTAIKTVDGSGSGLDADTLDGQHGSHYRINVYNSSGTLLN